MSKFYTVTGYKKYETIYGMTEEEQTFIMDFAHSSRAVSQARELFLQGGYSSIYISFSHYSASAYYNPAVGISATGYNWIEFFESEVI